MNLIKLKINIKSLAAEARINRAEARKCRGWDRYDLNAHRTGKLRYEARLANLAYAFLRDIPYKRVEQRVSVDTMLHDQLFLATALTTKINRFSSRVTVEDVEAWLKTD